jgi:chromosome segregation ATPase
MKKLTVIIPLVVLISACASTKPPNEKLTQVEASIQQAEQVGAENYAPLEIREARKKLDQARELVRKEKYEKAKRTADRAMVDAELAQMKSLSEKAQKAVRELRESIRVLKEEIQNNIDKERG